MFFMQIMEAFLVRTDPASSMVKPAHIHMTRAPHTRKEKVLKTKAVSSSTPNACATPGRRSMSRTVAMPVAARTTGIRWRVTTHCSGFIAFHLRRNTMRNQASKRNLPLRSHSAPVGFPCALYRGWVNGYYRRGSHG